MNLRHLANLWVGYDVDLRADVGEPLRLALRAALAAVVPIDVALHIPLLLLPEVPEVDGLRSGRGLLVDGGQPAARARGGVAVRRGHADVAVAVAAESRKCASLTFEILKISTNGYKFRFSIELPIISES